MHIMTHVVTEETVLWVVLTHTPHHLHLHDCRLYRRHLCRQYRFGLDRDLGILQHFMYLAISQLWTSSARSSHLSEILLHDHRIEHLLHLFRVEFQSRD
jgi:hypothetical protein